MTDPTPATRLDRAPRTEAGRRVVTFSTVAGVDIRNWRGYPAEVIAIEDEARAAVLEAARERESKARHGIVQASIYLVAGDAEMVHKELEAVLAALREEGT